MDGLPIQEGEEKGLAALIRGCLPNAKPEDFPPDPEKACKRLHTFLGLWYVATNNKKPVERKAFAQACKRAEHRWNKGKSEQPAQLQVISVEKASISENWWKIQKFDADHPENG